MKHWPVATLINTLTVIAGALIGWGFENILSEELRAIIFQAIGLGTLLIGIKMSLEVPEGLILTIIFSLILGGIIGYTFNFEGNVTMLSEHLKSTLSIQDARFSEGLITAFLLFCVGSMTIVGALEEGLKGKRTLILVKSTLDFFAAIALASTLGIGVLFSAIPLLFFQAGITLLSTKIEFLFDEIMLALITSVGGLLIIGIGINILKLGHIDLLNLLPAIFMVLFLGKLRGKLNITFTLNDESG